MSTAPKRKPRSALDIISNASRPIATKPTTAHSIDPAKKLWCDTVWANLSVQARLIQKLPKEPYFDPETMLLSREVNRRLWGMLERLWDSLGPERAPLATPIMLEGGEVRWHSFMGDDRGEEAEIYEHDIDAFMSRNRKPGQYDG